MRCVTLIVLVCLTTLAVGCRSGNKAKEMSEPPYFLKYLDARWDVALKALRSGDPEAIGFCMPILMDMTDTLGVMEAKYQGPNREAAIAKLREILETYKKDLSTQVRVSGGSVTLLPGATPADVLTTVEKAHAEYPKFREMVKL